SHPSHVVAVFNPRRTLANLYIDGKLAASVTPSSGRWTVPRTTIPLRLGADQEGGNRFVGSISRLAVYDRAFTTEQVAEHFEKSNSLAGVIGEWRLASTAGDVIQPESGTAALTAPVDIEPSDAPAQGPLTLWYRKPAREWVEALPLGNGRLGAMVFGGVTQE